MPDPIHLARPECVLVLSTDPPIPGNWAWRKRLIEWIQPQLAARLRTDPRAREFSFELGPVRVDARVTAGAFRPGGTFRLQFEGPPSGLSDPDGSKENPHPSVALPNPELASRGGQLVGLDCLIDQALLELRCRWSDALPRWSEVTGMPIPVPLREHFGGSSAVMVFSGDPGTGKTSAALVLADRFCRETHEAGVLLQVTTAEARGNGLVGDLGRRITALFREASRQAETRPVFVVIDEGDALATSRSGERMHHEDRAGTSALIQALDSLAGARVAVIITTNLPGSVDAAIRRRAREFPFPRPDRTARTALLARWLPQMDRNGLRAAVAVTDQHTAADLNRALTDAYLTAIVRGQPVTRALVLDRLRKATPTRSV